MEAARRRCSLLLFVATPAEEDALRQAAGERSLPFERVKDAALGEFHWMGTVGDETVVAARPLREGGRVAMGPHGRLGSAAKAIRFAGETGAAAIVQVGMAFGIDPLVQQLGDVLVSSALIPYDNRDMLPSPDPPGYRADYSKAAHEPARRDLIEMFKKERARAPLPYTVHIGPILSGAARIHCAAFRDELARSVLPDALPLIGGEMEGVGLLAASVDGKTPIWCVVKGISDFADENRDVVITAARPVACLNAARFVLSALVNNVPG